MRNINLDYDTCDNITRLILTETRDGLLTDVVFHPDDKLYNKKMSKRITKVLEHFGGELYDDGNKFISSPSISAASKELEAYFATVGKRVLK